MGLANNISFHNVQSPAKDRLGVLFNRLRMDNKVTTQKDFAQKSGIHATDMSKYLSGKMEFTPTLLVKLEDVFGVNRRWLTTGEGDMFGGAGPMRPTGEELRAQKAFGEKPQLGIPAVRIPSQANYRLHLADQYFERELERFFIPGFPYDGDTFRAWQIEGDSMTYINAAGMEEGLLDKEWIISEVSDPRNWSGRRNWYIYTIVTETLITTKRLYKLNDFEFAMIPDNPHYPQELLNIEDIGELWLFKRKLEWNAAPPRQYEITVTPKRGDIS